MNGNHVRPKLKIRNRVLAIIVAFLLLSLMIPHAVFATESTDATIVDPAKEVNNEATANPDANLPVAEEDANLPATPVAEANGTISGTIQDSSSSPISGATVIGYKDGLNLGEATTIASGAFSFDSTAVATGEEVLIVVVKENYVTEYAYCTVGTPITVAMHTGVSATIKPGDENHGSFTIKTSVNGKAELTQTSTAESFPYIIPENGTYKMTHNAHLLINYQDHYGKAIQIEFIGSGSSTLYRAYFWGHRYGAVEEEMKINEPYTFTTGNNYEIGIFYQGQGNVSFSSDSEAHENFHLLFIKNNEVLHDITIDKFAQPTYITTVCTVQEDGTVKMNYADMDPVNPYVVDATITPLCKVEGMVPTWTCNGKEMKAGDTEEITFGNLSDFKVSYVPKASTAPATGDMDFVWIIALSGIALGAAAGALRFRKNH